MDQGKNKTTNLAGNQGQQNQPEKHDKQPAESATVGGGTGGNADDDQDNTDDPHADRHHDKGDMQEDGLQRVKLYEAVFLFHDQAYDRNDPNGITDRRAYLPAQPQTKFTCIH